jgi:YfiH family protein
VHGARVVTVTRPGEHAGIEADAAVTAVAGCRLAVRTADCVPIVIAGGDAVAVVHAGWRGVAAGVVDSAVDAMRALGSEPSRAWLGPHIRAGCYEFGADDLAAVAARLGDHVRATTMWGTSALDLTAATAAALEAAGVGNVEDDGVCTACSTLYFSHRARGEHERFATIAWVE